MMGFIVDVIERESPTRCAMVTIDQDGGRREWTFGEIAPRPLGLLPRT